MAEFEDLSDFLKKHYHHDLYKKSSKNTNTVETRLIKMNKHRRSNRHEAAYEKRKIPANMSPVVTPAKTPMVKRTKTPPPKVEPQKAPPVNNRIEMLIKWKAEREKKKAAEKKKLKPVFKVSCVPLNVGLPNLQNVNNEIKGKPFKSKFAPPNHKFKPPSNIKPIFFHNSRVPRGSETSEKTKTPSVSRMVTRSQARSNLLKSGNQDKQVKSTNVKAKTPKKKTPQIPKEHAKELNKTGNETADKEKTPVRNGKPAETVKTPVYISPFVTVSRSKANARKEYEARRSGKSFLVKEDQDICSSPKAGAIYFRTLLDNQISRLEGVCNEWTKYKDDPTLPEEAVSMIDVAIGQTNLLLTKKFMQFQGLIDKCQDATTETPVTCEDLHGFWDMMLLQVDNVDKRFDNLKNLKANNWEEILPEPKKEVQKKDIKRKNVKASAGLRAAIQAARKKNLDAKRLEGVRQTPQSRNSPRMSVLKSEERKRLSNTSPGLMMMKVAQYAKSVETPGKSILRTDARKSVKSHSKSVIFYDDVENDRNNSNLERRDETSRRKSGRLTRSKLF